MKARPHGQISLDAGNRKILEPAHAAIKAGTARYKARISPGKDIFPVFRNKCA
jgi:hypothetical protein